MTLDKIQQLVTVTHLLTAKRRRNTFLLELLMSIHIDGTVFEDIQRTIDRVANHTDELITEIQITLNGTTIVVSQLGDAVTVLLSQLYTLIFWTLIIVIPVLCVSILLITVGCLIRNCRRPVRYIPHYREIPLVRENYNSSKVFRESTEEV